ncbi:thiol-disulfide oxidoreductase DCC family protein [Longimicrobium sp.]|uniref:thiol-disulfide oxidoreductase DCC family protein n=1 Tax=Longimicrobium sp. TaxID=2029185 RepID=UPI003B3A26A5
MSAAPRAVPPRAALDVDGPIVLYDGVCGLCDRSVQLILRNDRRGRFRFAALQSDPGRALLHAFGLSTETLDSIVLVEGGRAWRKSAAALRIARRMDAPWPLLWPLALVPRVVADVFYDLVARNRYRIFGKLDACMIPPPEVRARFLG